MIDMIDINLHSTMASINLDRRNNEDKVILIYIPLWHLLISRPGSGEQRQRCNLHSTMASINLGISQ